MQGDNTDSILTGSVTSNFNNNLTKYLTARSKMSVGEAFNLALIETKEKAMKTTINYTTILFAIFWIAFTLASMRMNFEDLNESSSYKNAVEVEKDAKEFRCEYCGCTYTKEIAVKYEYVCPHCSASLPGIKE